MREVASPARKSPSQSFRQTAPSRTWKGSLDHAARPPSVGTRPRRIGRTRLGSKNRGLGRRQPRRSRPAEVGAGLDSMDRRATRLAPRPKRPCRARRPNRAPFGGWSRFKVVCKQGVTVLRLTDQNLVKETEIRELTEDLLGLIEAGHHRLLISFGSVDRLSSWVAGAIAEAQKRCLATGDGLLKICDCNPPSQRFFSMLDQARGIPICSTQSEALEGPWPQASRPRPLPVDIFSRRRLAPAIRPRHPIGARPNRTKSRAFG